MFINVIKHKITSYPLLLKILPNDFQYGSQSKFQPPLDSENSCPGIVQILRPCRNDKPDKLLRETV